MSDYFALTYARVWLAGKSPKAPGTCGSLVAIFLAPFIFMPLPIWIRIFLLAILFYTGAKAAEQAGILLKKKDPPEVVIDEVLGQLVTCLPFSTLSFWGYAAAFLLFRLFDITKPGLIKKAESSPGGYGIMLDDFVAGIYAMGVLGVISWLFPWFLSSA